MHLQLRGALGSDVVEEFSVYTEPITLYPGQVNNAPVYPAALPDWIVRKFAGKDMGVLKFQLDIVERPGPDEVRVPLSEVYNHHTIEAMGQNATTHHVYHVWSKRDPLGPAMPHCGTVLAFPVKEGSRFVSKWSEQGGSMWVGPSGGAEYRDADRDLPAPFRQIVRSPESMLAIVHLINIDNAPYSPKDWQRIYECPCTSERVINATNGTIDGARPLPFHCSDTLLRQRNAACKLEWYRGGYRCCQHHDFVTERSPPAMAPRTVYAKWTFRVTEVRPETRAVVPGAFDVTEGNAEYDVPACDPTTGTLQRSECVHVATAWNNVALALAIPGKYLAECPDGYAEVISAHGHQHVGGLGMDLYDAGGQLLCKSQPVYDDSGFIVGIPPCIWGPPPLRPPPRLRWNDSVFLISRYNASEERYGAMGFWFVQVSHQCGNRSAVLI